jgi:hypothetical protein
MCRTQNSRTEKSMTRTLIVVASVLCLAVPAALAAPPAGKGKPESPGKSAAAPGHSAEKHATSQTAEQPGQSGQNAAKKCKAERALGEDAFKARYGTNANKANAFGKCVSSKAKTKTEADDENENEANENKAEQNAAKKCKAERALGEDAFKARYGTNTNKANAFGKCVSKLSKAKHTS